MTQASDKKLQKRHCLGCKKETFPNYRCVCGGSHGGGDHEGEEKSTKHSPLSLLKTEKNLTDTKTILTETIDNILLPWQLRLEQRTLDPLIIAKLLSEKLLTLESDPELGTLTLKFNYKTNLLPEEYKKELLKLIAVLLNELEKFKLENNIQANSHELRKDKDGNLLSLRIMLSPKLYEAFIKQLLQKDLLSHAMLQTPHQQQAASRLNLKLTPELTKKKKEEEDQQAVRKPTLQQLQAESIRPRSPLDLLKLRR